MAGGSCRRMTGTPFVGECPREDRSPQQEGPEKPRQRVMRPQAAGGTGGCLSAGCRAAVKTRRMVNRTAR